MPAIHKVFVSTHPFGSVNSESLDILARSDIQVDLNPYGRKIKPEELKQCIRSADALIAGTERIDTEVLDCAPELKLIARAGIGIDNIDLDEIRRRGILLTYTPDAVSQAVAELTVANMINVARFIPQIHMAVQSRQWQRIIGFEIANKTVGLIGFGRVGQRVAKMLQGFSCNLLVNDIAPDQETGSRYGVKFCSKEDIYREADIISLHIPKTRLTQNLIKEREIGMMKPTVCLINTSRGNMIDETALYHALKTGEIAGATIDVYEQEPYSGPLTELDNVILTAHSGSCSREARYQMELGAAQEVVRFVEGKPPLIPVTDDVIQAERSTKISKVSLEWHEVLNRSEEPHDERYKLYRKRWTNFPTHRIVAPYPLNIDIELVHNPLQGHENDRMTDYFLSTPDPGATMMQMSLFYKIMEEFGKIPEPTAIKLGVRGNVFGHPHLQDTLAAISEVDCVETIINTHIRDLQLVHATLLNAMVDAHLHVLNVFVDASKEPGEALNVLLEIRKRRATRALGCPKLRIVGNLAGKSLEDQEAFVSYWRNWSDIVAFEDVNDARRKVSEQDCDEFRLWQRLTISAEGNILPYNFDVEEKHCLGQFPAISIQDAWLGEKMQKLRAFYIAK